MPTVVDSLVLEFSLDPRKFTAAQKDILDQLRKLQDQSKRSGKAVESQQATMENYFASLKRSVLTVAAVFLGGKGLKEAVNYMVTMDAATGRVAKTMNTSAKDVSVWQGAIKGVGGSAEAATGALQGLSSDLNNLLAGAGGGESLTLFRKLGIDIFNQNKQLKTANELYQELVGHMDKIRKRHGDAQTVSMLSTIPGMNQDMINLLISGDAPERLRKAIAAGTPTPEDVKNAQEYQTSMAGLERSMEGLWRTAMRMIAPGATSVFDSVTNFLQGWNKKANTQTTSSPWELLRQTVSGYSFPIKNDAGQSTPTTRAAMSTLSGMPGISAVTSLKDSHHKTGKHAAGHGIDLTISDPAKSAEMVEQIKARLAAAGIKANVIDEYKTKSPGWTGPHIHIGITPAALAPGGSLDYGAPAASTLSNSSSAPSKIGNSANSLVIDNINIYTNSGDADSIARGITPAIKRSGLAAPANWGPN